MIYEDVTLIPIVFYDSDSSDGGRPPESKRPPSPPPPPPPTEVDFEITDQTPTCLVFDRYYERVDFLGNGSFGEALVKRRTRSFLRGYYSNLGDVHSRTSQGICLYRLFDNTNGATIKDLMVPGLSPHYRIDPQVTHWISTSLPGIPVEIPYYIGSRRDLYSPPSITFRLYWNTNKPIYNAGIRVTVGTQVLTYSHGDIPVDQKGFADFTVQLPHIPDGVGTIGTFYHYRFWIGLLSNSPFNHIRYKEGIEANSSGAFAGYGFSWLVLNVRTQMPRNVNFEFKLQNTSWLTSGWHPVKNDDLVYPVNHTAHSGANLYGPVGFSKKLSNPTGLLFSLDTFWRWNVFSSNTEDQLYLNGFHWKFDIERDFPVNKKYGLPIFFCNIRGIPQKGVWSQDSIDLGLNVGLNINLAYFTDQVTVRHDGWSRYYECLPSDFQFTSGTAALYGLTWLDDDESQFFKKKYMFIPYNSVCMLRLVEGSPTNDVTFDIYPNVQHTETPPYSCLYPYPFVYSQLPYDSH